MDKIVLKWKMLSYTEFRSEQNGYEINVVSGGAFGYGYWDIKKDGIVVDCCYYHPPTSKGELSARVQAQKRLNVLLTLQPYLKLETNG